jgi:hypothetical protein
METVIFVPDPTVWRRSDAPGGLALLERLLRQLAALGRARLTLLVPAGDPPPEVAADPDVAVVHVPDGGDAFAALAVVASTLPASFLFMSADHLVDARVLRALATASDSSPVTAARHRSGT